MDRDGLVVMVTTTRARLFDRIFSTSTLLQPSSKIATKYNQAAQAQRRRLV